MHNTKQCNSNSVIMFTEHMNQNTNWTLLRNIIIRSSMLKKMNHNIHSEYTLNLQFEPRCTEEHSLVLTQGLGDITKTSYHYIFFLHKLGQCCIRPDLRASEVRRVEEKKGHGFTYIIRMYINREGKKKWRRKKSAIENSIQKSKKKVNLKYSFLYMIYSIIRKLMFIFKY